MAKKIKIKSGNENYESVSLTEYLNAIKIAKADGNINIRGKHYLPDTAELYANGNVTETETSPLSTANAIAVTRRGGTAGNPLPALTAGDILEVAILESNTGAATLSIDGGAPIAINLDGAPLPAGSLERGSYVNFIYNGVSVDRESDATVETARAVDGTAVAAAAVAAAASAATASAAAVASAASQGAASASAVSTAADAVTTTANAAQAAIDAAAAQVAANQTAIDAAATAQNVNLTAADVVTTSAAALAAAADAGLAQVAQGAAEVYKNQAGNSAAAAAADAAATALDVASAAASEAAAAVSAASAAADALQAVLKPSLDISQAGAGPEPISIFKRTIKLKTTAAGGAFTLADSGTEGQKITLVFTDKDTSNAVVTPANLNAGAILTFTNVGEYATLIFLKTEWYMLEATAIKS